MSLQPYGYVIFSGVRSLRVAVVVVFVGERFMFIYCFYWVWVYFEWSGGKGWLRWAGVSWVLSIMSNGMMFVRAFGTLVGNFVSTWLYLGHSLRR